MSKIRTKQHENPLELAQRIRDTPAGLRSSLFSLRRSTLYTYKRMSSATVLLPGMDTVLNDAHAVGHIVRWVCWGKLMPNRILRLALALHVRRELTRIGQAESGLCWLKDAQQNIAESIFLESQRGQATLDWIRSSMYNAEYQDSHGGFSDRFWFELIRKVEQAIPLDKFWGEIDKRVAAKPKRNPPKKFRKRAAARPEPMPKKIRDAMDMFVGYMAEQYGIKKE